jgi:hypothetical protein
MLRISRQKLLTFVVVAALPFAASGTSIPAVGQADLQMRQMAKKVPLQFAQMNCQQVCRNNCGFNDDGSVNGGFNALERANACYRNCFQRCVRN